LAGACPVALWRLEERAEIGGCPAPHRHPGGRHPGAAWGIVWPEPL